MKALSNITVTNKKDKEDTWYQDTAAAVYMTHDLSLYITADLDNQTADIETANGNVLWTQGAGTIDLHDLVENEHMHIELSNVHYLPELDTNLISLEVLEEKRCEFRAVDELLQIKDKKDDIILKSIRDNAVYPLHQLKLQAQNRLCQNITKTNQIAKPATKEKGHKGLANVNNKDLAKMPKIATGISFLKDDTNTEPDFCKACTLGKQNKVNSKESPIDTRDKPGVRLYADLFDGENTLPGVRGYQYRKILTDEATSMRFPITMNLEHAICDETHILFNRIKTYTGRKIQYF